MPTHPRAENYFGMESNIRTTPRDSGGVSSPVDSNIRTTPRNPGSIQRFGQMEAASFDFSPGMATSLAPGPAARTLGNIDISVDRINDIFNERARIHSIQEDMAREHNQNFIFQQAARDTIGEISDSHNLGLRSFDDITTGTPSLPSQLPELNFMERFDNQIEQLPDVGSAIWGNVKGSFTDKDEFIESGVEFGRFAVMEGAPSVIGSSISNYGSLGRQFGFTPDRTVSKSRNRFTSTLVNKVLELTGLEEHVGEDFDVEDTVAFSLMNLSEPGEEFFVEQLERGAQEIHGYVANRQKQREMERINKGLTPRNLQTFAERIEDNTYLWGEVLGSGAPSLLVPYGFGTAAKLSGLGRRGIATTATAGTANMSAGAFRQEAIRYARETEDPDVLRLLEDDDFVDALSLVQGTVVGLLASAPATVVLTRSPVGRKILHNTTRESMNVISRNMVQLPLLEGGTEVLQQVVANSFAKVYDEERSAFEGSGEAFLAGMMFGSVPGIVGDLMPIVTNRPDNVQVLRLDDGDANQLAGAEFVIEDGRDVAGDDTIRARTNQEISKMEERSDLNQQGTARLASLRRAREKDDLDTMANFVGARRDGQESLQGKRFTMPETAQQARNPNIASGLNTLAEISAVQDALRATGMQLSERGSQAINLQDSTTDSLESLPDNLAHSFVIIQETLQTLDRVKNKNHTAEMVEHTTAQVMQQIDGMSESEPQAKVNALKDETESISERLQDHPAIEYMQYIDAEGNVVLPKRILNRDGISDSEAQAVINEFDELLNRLERIEESVTGSVSDISQALDSTHAVRVPDKQSQLESESYINRLAGKVNNGSEVTAQHIESLRNHARDNVTDSAEVDNINLILDAVSQGENVMIQTERFNTALSYTRNVINSQVKQGVQSRLQSWVRNEVESGNITGRVAEKVQALMQDPELEQRTEGVRQQINELKDITTNLSGGTGLVSPIAVKMVNLIDSVYSQPLDQVSLYEIEGAINQVKRMKRREVDAETVLKSFEGQTSPLNRSEVTHKVPGQTESMGESLTRGLKNSVERIKGTARAVDRSLLFMDVLFDKMGTNDGSYNGPVYNFFKRTIDNNWVMARKSQTREVDALYDFIKQNNLDVDTTNDTTVERLGIVLTREQEGGMQRLLEDPGLTEQDINAVELTADERALADYMKDRLNTYFPVVQEVGARVLGETISQIEDYFPFHVDTGKLRNFKGRHGDNGIARGGAMAMNDDFLMSRQEVGDALELDALKVFINHTSRANYLINMAEDLQLMREVANSDRFGEMVGNQGQMIVQDWLDTVATDGASDITNGWSDWFRKNASAGVLGVRLSTLFVQPSQLISGMSMIGPRYPIRGMAALMKPEWRDMIQRFPEMVDRQGGELSIQELTSDTLIQRLNQKAFTPLKKIDGVFASATALGAYMQFMDANGLQIDPNAEPNREALNFAQLVVRKTQSTGLAKDLPPALRGGQFGTTPLGPSFNKAALQFQNFVLTEWGRTRYDGVEVAINNRDIKQAGAHLGATAMATIISTGLRSSNKMIQQWIGNVIWGQDDDQREWMEELERAFIFESIGRVPILGPISMTMQYDSNPIPILDLGKRGLTSLHTAVTAESQEAKLRGYVTALLSGIALFAGLGATQLNEWVNNAISRMAVDRQTGTGGVIQSPDVPTMGDVRRELDETPPDRIVPARLIPQRFRN